MRAFKTFMAVLTLILLSSINGFSQNAEMADVMRSEGKIYVVVAIILIVLAGVLGYLFFQDRKLKKLERLLEEQSKPKR